MMNHAEESTPKNRRRRIVKFLGGLFRCATLHPGYLARVDFPVFSYSRMEGIGRLSDPPTPPS